MSAASTRPLAYELAEIFEGSAKTPLDEIMPRVLATISSRLPCDCAFILSLPKRRRLPSRQASPDTQTPALYLPPEFASFPERVLLYTLVKQPLFGSLIRHPRQIELTPLSHYVAQEERALLRKFNLDSLLLLPLLTFGETRLLVGALDCSGGRYWHQDLVAELRHNSGLIAAALEFRRKDRAQKFSEDKYQGLFHQLPLACALVNDDNRLCLLNSVAMQNLPLENGDDLLAMVRTEEHSMLLNTLRVVREGVLTRSWCELPLKTLRGPHWLKLSFSRGPGQKLAGGGNQSLLMMAEDVSERYRLADELSFQANYDALTGLPNRLHFEQVLSRLLKTKDNSQVSIAFIDLDQFQVINNISGYQAGDRLLCQIANRLKELVRKEDLVARLGGDEFGILMCNSSLDTVKQAAERICRQLFKHDFNWEGRQHNVSVSIGLACLNKQDIDIYNVVGQADAACHVVKDRGRNDWHLYCDTDPQIHRRYTEMLASVDIVSALSEDRFELYFQPIAPLHDYDGGLHLEILLRMQRPDGSLLSPGIFLPAAERYNLAPRVDLWVVEHLLQWGTAHPTLWRELSMVSVNLSATSLGDPQFMDWLEMRLLAEPELVDKLCFEITETAALSQLQQATRLIELLRPLGCKLALDDFGSGFSSFAYLKCLDVDFVKIDGQFVQNLCANRADQAIVSAICQLGLDMEFETIAEFVESESIGHQLRSLGVDYAQGYGIAAPARLATLVSGLSAPWLPLRQSQYVSGEI
ncbi:EAL domain-containing protein [Shewanella sp. AS16]|uniref:putative bifunctional diguanylate cyclase/phosphodiesterase n=1 Tax=Shewanella sp. AS16 TaxID=2907625 RepID=UPI001F3E4044|nr:EAL domain-containing protein [Shewanella sp. AS16]MCE9685766.1 EAL domain-containing protein [Shewanella sp. AS16]